MSLPLEDQPPDPDDVPYVSMHSGPLRESWCPVCLASTALTSDIIALVIESGVSVRAGGIEMCMQCGWSPYARGQMPD